MYSPGTSFDLYSSGTSHFLTCSALIQSRSIFYLYNSGISHLLNSCTVRKHHLTFTVLQVIFWPAVLWYSPGPSFDLYSSGTSHLLTCTAVVQAGIICWLIQFWNKPSFDLHSSGTVRTIFWPIQKNIRQSCAENKLFCHTSATSRSTVGMAPVSSFNHV